MDYWPQDAKIIQVDADHKVLGLVKKISVGVCGDVKAFSKTITERLSSETLASDGSKEQRAKKIAEEKKAWEDELDNWTHEKDPYSLDVIEEAKNERSEEHTSELQSRGHL